MNLMDQELIEIRQDEQLDLNNLSSYLKDTLNMQFKNKIGRASCRERV